MILLEKLLPESFADRIENEVNSPFFPWYYMDEIGHDYQFSGNFKNPLISNPVGMTHIACINDEPNSPYFNLFQPVLYFMEQRTGLIAKHIVRIRLRRTFFSKGHYDGMYNLPHVDLPITEPYKTLVYYVGNSDGDTVLFNEKHSMAEGEPTIKDEGLTIAMRSSPIKNNAVLFDGDTFHAGNAPVAYRERTIVNFDFIVN